MTLYDFNDKQSTDKAILLGSNSTLTTPETIPDKNHPSLYMGDKSPTPILWELTPKYKNQPYTRQDKGWKSIQGWINEANKERTLLLLNAEHTQYTYEMVIDITEELTEEQIKKQWSTIYKILYKNKVVAYWRIEINKRNRIHWHLTFSSTHNMSELKIKIKNAINYKSNIKYQPITRVLGHIGYVLKAKTQIGDRKDISINDRVFFKKEVKLRRSGTIGNFWIIPKKTLNKIRIERKAQWNKNEDEKYMVQYPHLKIQIDLWTMNKLDREEQIAYYKHQCRKHKITGEFKSLWNDLLANETKKSKNLSDATNATNATEQG